MKIQVVVIHGGDVFNSYDEYLSNLRATTFDLTRVSGKGWKQSLGEMLGEDFEVIQTRMPNAQNAKYLEWEIWFEKFIPLLTEEVIFVGHSLGGIFLAKYLSEHTYPKNILATYLIAAPFNTNTKHLLADFIVNEDLSLFLGQGGEIVLCHSTDDEVVPYDNALWYQEAIPTARLLTFSDRQHFNQEVFPELVADIRVVASHVHK